MFMARRSSASGQATRQSRLTRAELSGIRVMMSISHSQSGLASETEELLNIRHFGRLVGMLWYLEDDRGWVDVEVSLYSFSSSKCSRGGTGLSYREIGKPVRCSGASRDNIHSRVRALGKTQPCVANRAEIAPVA
jgi:hypothetical protein